MTCKHENADHLMPGQFTMLESGALVTAQCEQFRCIDCGAWLPLGPAKDDGPFAEAVAIEVRAAEIAADLESGGCWMSPFERWGFNDELPPLRGGGTVHCDTDSQRSGYLAHCIATHDEGAGGQ